ncbi:rho GTPase-activating protein 2-like [Gastrolobium bilobum]|uniref:rho GTPase-activating protein 2-like n=1 Tax=Gastrolobium bilobum TaxID=150636 RepID=UPI002AB103EE|nr:rho GTPase-activating protein 2-like [Gastrolobium bilobum]
MTGPVMVTKGGGCGGEKGRRMERVTEEEQNQLSPVAVVLAALRKSMVACSVESPDDVISAVHPMEIGWPTNVKHISHVTFDRFNGFLGLPVELEVDIPGRVPSASVSVFGVSAESMQCSYDSKGNSVPTILLLMQERLYSQGGLKAEGIFRINPENSEEEHLRDQLNRGIVPDDIDVHCLAGLIKAWFRELPSGVLDGLSPEQVLQCNTEEESVHLVKQLKPTESALLNWAIDLMADVVEEEEYNKMDARNIAMVFAPNMTQMSDPLTALMHAVQVMNLLKTLILKTLREREETATAGYSSMSFHSSDRQSEDEYDSQQEMDISGELRGNKSDYDDHVNCSRSNEEEEEEKEAASVNDIEECLLKWLDENTKGFSEEPEGYLQEEFDSPRNCSGYKVECAMSFTDIKTGNSCSSSSYGDDSRTTLTAEGTSSPSIGSTGTYDVEMMDKFTDSISLVPLFASG